MLLFYSQTRRHMIKRFLFCDGCVALSRGAMGLSAVVIVVFPDHTHLLFLIEIDQSRAWKNRDRNKIILLPLICESEIKLFKTKIKYLVKKLWTLLYCRTAIGNTFVYSNFPAGNVTLHRLLLWYIKNLIYYSSVVTINSQISMPCLHIGLLNNQYNMFGYSNEPSH